MHIFPVTAVLPLLFIQPLYMSDNFPVQNGLKLANALSPLLYNFALEHAIRKVQENQTRLKLKGAHRLRVYADVNLLGDNTDTIKKTHKLYLTLARRLF
jgi:hypothetical protein